MWGNALILNIALDGLTGCTRQKMKIRRCVTTQATCFHQWIDTGSRLEAERSIRSGKGVKIGNTTVGSETEVRPVFRENSAILIFQINNPGISPLADASGCHSNPPFDVSSLESWRCLPLATTIERIGSHTDSNVSMVGRTISPVKISNCW